MISRCSGGCAARRPHRGCRSRRYISRLDLFFILDMKCFRSLTSRVPGISSWYCSALVGKLSSDIILGGPSCKTRSATCLRLASKLPSAGGAGGNGDSIYCDVGIAEKFAEMSLLLLLWPLVLLLCIATVRITA